jgi:hypothetical protein
MDSLLPFLEGSCIPYNMPVYPGALRFARYSGTIAKPSGMDYHTSGWRLLVKPRQRARRTIDDKTGMSGCRSEQHRWSESRLLSLGRARPLYQRLKAPITAQFNEM